MIQQGIGKQLRRLGALVVALGIVSGCKDMGTGPAPQSPAPAPVVQTRTISFSKDVLPVFSNPKVGCIGCHGGTNNLFVGTVVDLLRGGLHGPAIIPGNGAGSILVQKIGPNPPFGARMPFGGTPLPDSTIQMISAWIDQGAQNN